MRGFRPIVALTVVGTVASLLLPPGVVCFALEQDAPTACPMAALLMDQAAPCHGEESDQMGTAEPRCCCSIQQSPPPALPSMPDAVSDRTSVSVDGLPAATEAPVLEIPKEAPRRSAPDWIADHPPPPQLFLQHSAFLL
jgi:hypothetical protein